MFIVRKGFFHGWAVVGAVFLAGFASVAAYNPVLAVLMKPMASEMGWSRAAISGAMSAGSVAGGVLSLLVGPLVDRRGTRAVLAVGVVVMGLCLMAVSQVAALWQFYLLFGMSRAVSAGVVEMATSVAVANWFTRWRARAMGFAATGPRIGLACFPPLALLLLSWVGWREAWVGLGMFAWATAVLPIIVLVGRRPEDFGLRPDGDHEASSTRPGSSQHTTTSRMAGQGAQEHSWMVSEAVRTAPFWLLTASQAVTMMASGGVNLHQLPHLTDRGIPPAVAVGAVSSYAIWAMAGVLGWSFLTERIGVRHCLVANLGLSAAGVFVLAQVNSVPMAFFYSAFYGLNFGGQMALFPLVWADYFGRASLGAVRGVSWPVTMVFNAGGIYFAGWIYDSTGSYRTSFEVFIAAYLAGAVLMLVARAPTAAAVRQV